MEKLSIGLVAKQVGINPSAIRYYESIGLIPPPLREGGQRRYDKTIITQLKIITIAKSLDFTLKEIKLLLKGLSAKNPPSDLWRSFAESKLDAIESQIKRAQHIAGVLKIGLACTCTDPNDCVLTELSPLIN